jgi:hypothetical protein
MLIRQYTIPERDRVLRAYFLNRAVLSCIMGPVGGGKTLASLQRFIRFAKLQEPHPEDRVRRSRWVSIRGTYRDLERTTLRTWTDWWPKAAGEWRGGANGEPATHRLRFPLRDGTEVETEIIFAATGEQNIEEFAGGFEVTGFHVGEAAELPEDLYLKLLERAGRYPRVDAPSGFKGASWSGGWLDCNAPNYGNHIERNFVTDPKDGYAFFRQPGGLDSDAENLPNLPGGRRYYERIAASSREHYVRRFVHNNFGFDRSGKPIYPQYNPFRHFSKVTLKALRGRPLFCGLDQGRNPAAVFVQRSQAGQLRVLRELVMTNTGAREFARALRQMIDEEFPDWDITFVADPAAWNPTELSEDAADVWAMQVENVIDAPLVPALSTRRAAREQPFIDHMKESIDAETERLLVDPSCKMVHEGFNQMFRLRKVSATGQPDRYASEIEKNAWSHPCEAAEYAAMHAVGMGEVLGRKPRPVATDDPRAADWRPAGF